MTAKPTKEELENRIQRHLSWSSSSETVALLWHGYLTGIFEWGLISIEDHRVLSELLPKVGTIEVDEIFSGEPVSAGRRAEIEAYLKSVGKA